MIRTCCIILLFLLPGVVSAQKSSLEFNEVRLPKNFPAYNIRFAEQDEAGLLWFVSGNGLYRFDGNHLLHFGLRSNPALPSFPVTAMKAGLDGSLWLGFRNGAARFDLKNWCIEQVFAADWDSPEPRDRNICTIYRSPGGKVYFGTESGKLFVFEKGMLELVLDMTGIYRHSGRFAGIMTIQEPYPGELWITTGNGMLVYLPVTASGYGTPTYYKPQVALNRGIGSICFGPKGKCIFSVVSKGIYQLGTRELMRAVGDRFLDMNSKVTKGLVQELTLPEGATGSAHAPFYIPGRKSTYDGRNPSAREIGLIADPSEGAKNIYTYDFLSQTWRLETPARPVSFPGSKLHGVSTNPAATFVCSAAGITSLRFRDQALTPLLSGFNNPNSIRSVYKSSEGDLYIGSYRDRFIHFNEATGEVTHLSPMFIYSILPWSADTLLLATEGNDLQWYLPRENRFEQIHTNKAQLAAEGLAIDANVTALHRVNDTLLWAGTYQGAYLINPLRGTVYNVVTGSGSRLLQSSKVYDILSIQENGGNPFGKGEVSNPRKVLFATTAGVFELNLADGQVSYFLNENASESNRNTEVFCMQQVGDMIWMGTGGRGLTAAGPGGRLADMDWLNGELAGNVVFSMTRSGGSLLVGTGKGLSVIDLADSSVINYTTLNGLPAGEFNHSAVFGDSLQAYMGTVNGLVRWQAAGLLTDKEETDLRVYITRLLISDRDNQKRSLYRFPYQQENPEGISIPAGISYFSVNFSSLDEDIGLLALYYRIDPSGSWNGIDRRGEITFVETKPGNYRLELAGRAPDGTWITDLLSIPLQVKPAFHQTLLFKILMMLIPVLLVALVFRYREIQLQKERRLRIKIADDLHDEVGSSLTRIWHQASQAIPVMEQRKPLRAISETSREAIATMSDIVWSIDARFDTLRDLIMRMKDYVYKLEDELEIMLSFSVKGKVDDKKVSQIVRQNLFLLFKEAINNAMKHGSGGEIAIRMEVYEQIMLQIVNRCNANSNSAGTDDTRSLSDASLCPVQGGRGLQNMRRRAANMHGTLNAQLTGDEFQLTVWV